MATSAGSTLNLRSTIETYWLPYALGYRVYYGRDGDTVVILLGGGSKNRQAANIKTAKARWARYLKAR